MAYYLKNEEGKTTEEIAKSIGKKDSNFRMLLKLFRDKFKENESLEKAYREISDNE